MVTIMPKPQHEGIMMGPMKGHLAPNSSPFKPTINKLSSQYLIQDHMSNHYMKLGTAKPAIDNKPPKSMMTSVKKRDQMRREAMAKQMKLCDFEREMKHSGSPLHRQQTPDSGIYESHRLFSVTVSKNGRDEPRPQTMSSYSSSRASPRPRSASSHRSSRGSNPNSPRDRTRKPDVLDETYGGDYLDRHEQRFKNVGTPFTPRLKKHSGKSRLAQSRHYAPPLVVQKETKRKTAFKSPNKDEDVLSTSSVYGRTTPERSRSRDSKLLDDRTDSISRLSLDDSKQTYDNIYRESSTYDDYGFRQRSWNNTHFGASSIGRSFSRTDAFSERTKSRIEAEEEEMKYLEFINMVTNDILTRGIYSDRVLTQVMQRHLDQNRGRLNEGRMRHMLMKLQQDLGVSADFTMRGFDTTPNYASSYDGSSVSGKDRRDSRKDKDTRRSSSPTRRKSSEKSVPTKNREASDGGVSDGSGRSRKGILKTPATSSGSDLEARSFGLSSGEEDDKTKPKKVTVKENSGIFAGENAGEVIAELKAKLAKKERGDTPESSQTGPAPPIPKKRTHVVESETAVVGSESVMVESEIHSLDRMSERDDLTKRDTIMAKEDTDDGTGSDSDGF